jgi:hypothetical protein
MIIIYQYKESPINEWRLRYSVRSLENLEGYNRIAIVGDRPKILKPDSYEYVPHKYREAVKLEERVYDRCSKMLAVIDRTNLREFTILYDDMYFINQVNINEYAVPIARVPLGDEEHLKQYGSPHEKNIIRTLEALREAGKPDYNYETHLPRTYNRKYLRNLMYNWAVRENRYLPSTIYFNDLFKRPVEIIDKTSPLILGIHGYEGLISHNVDSRKQIEKLASDRYMMNTGPNIPKVVTEWLEKRFPHRSKMEI